VTNHNSPQRNVTQGNATRRNRDATQCNVTQRNATPDDQEVSVNLRDQTVREQRDLEGTNTSGYTKQQQKSSTAHEAVLVQREERGHADE
jgi:hypothetical protein